MKTLVVTPTTTRTGSVGLEPTTSVLETAILPIKTKFPECADGVLAIKDRHTIAVHNASSGERTLWLLPQ